MGKTKSRRNGNGWIKMMKLKIIKMKKLEILKKIKNMIKKKKRRINSPQLNSTIH